MTKYTGSANTLEIAVFETNNFVAFFKVQKYTKSCMLKQMLLRDWDAHKVASVAKEYRLYTEFIWSSVHT